MIEDMIVVIGRCLIYPVLISKVIK